MAGAVTYTVRKRGQQCEACGRAFVEHEKIHSQLIFEEGAYRRIDSCPTCPPPAFEYILSSWKTPFMASVPPQEEVLKKESAESLLRKLIDDSGEEQLNAIYILAVMLERKKLLVERDIQIQPNGTKLRVYEHKKSGETFLITDPDIKLSELQHVQEEVVYLISGAPGS